MDEINAVPPPGRAASSPMFKQPVGAPGRGRMVQETYDPIQGMDRAADASQEQGDESELAAQDVQPNMSLRQQQAAMHQAGHVSLDPSRPEDQSAMLQHSQVEDLKGTFGGRGLRAADTSMRPDPLETANDAKYNVSASYGQPHHYDPDNPEATRMDPSEVLDHPVAKAIVGSGKRHTALRQFLDMVHKPEQK